MVFSQISYARIQAVYTPSKWHNSIPQFVVLTFTAKCSKVKEMWQTLNSRLILLCTLVEKMKKLG